MDIAIIGGGAAGFMAAIMARRTNPSSKVTIFERAQKVLAKVEITGGGRCNVTNSFAAITDMKPGLSTWLYAHETIDEDL